MVGRLNLYPLTVPTSPHFNASLSYQVYDVITLVEVAPLVEEIARPVVIGDKNLANVARRLSYRA